MGGRMTPPNEDVRVVREALRFDSSNATAALDRLEADLEAAKAALNDRISDLDVCIDERYRYRRERDAAQAEVERLTAALETAETARDVARGYAERVEARCRAAELALREVDEYPLEREAAISEVEAWKHLASRRREIARAALAPHPTGPTCDECGKPATHSTTSEGSRWNWCDDHPHPTGPKHEPGSYVTVAHSTVPVEVVTGDEIVTKPFVVPPASDTGPPAPGEGDDA